MKNYFTLFLLFASFTTFAQVAQEIPEPPFIKTVQFNASSTSGTSLPILQLGSSLSLSFDDIYGDERDYFYKITHHNADWTESSLARSEYMDGMDNVRILNFENSVATLQLYTHYELSIPNQMTKRLTKTGNYLLSIYDEEGELVFSRKFMIFSPQFNVGAQVKRSRDLQYINSKQVLRFFIDSGDEVIINPKQNLHTVLIQNNNLKTAITGIEPQYNIGNRLEYRYDQETAFWGGNEFFNFENKDVRAATFAIKSIELKSLYHNYLYSNPARYDQPYTYNPDINGNFLINTLQGRTPLTEAEYVWIHFSLRHPKLLDDQSIHLYGNFNNYVIDNSTKLEWNTRTRRYELPYLLKQGFYNYNYVLVNKDGSIDYKNSLDGNFWQTENNYQILVYYRKPGGRFDELVGLGQTNSSQITN
ncbi:type IX secretion system plug protein [Dokdonia donghaensis]|uniref:ApaG n=1 Tax=Dokdonia donghaensis DSW-1 TaxID=1300343 RepID=A0A0A2GTG1_9FLAO|nr:DUF5103 domain-containing protein [Dokdonia donghaensis]ANH59141.1 hypothetical protein I597_0207 [Dokdonia donghaensis DSW-1]KGO06564.1 ApaG [Dokdonia donghaensis DSW-1]